MAATAAADGCSFRNIEHSYSATYLSVRGAAEGVGYRDHSLPVSDEKAAYRLRRDQRQYQQV
jgi:hypothetical protein